MRLKSLRPHLMTAFATTALLSACSKPEGTEAHEKKDVTKPTASQNEEKAGADKTTTTPDPTKPAVVTTPGVTPQSGAIGVDEDEAAVTQQRKDLGLKLVNDCGHGQVPADSENARFSCTPAPFDCAKGQVNEGADASGVRPACRDTPGMAIVDGVEAEGGLALLTDFRTVTGWANWLCNDVGNNQSDWYLAVKGPESVLRYSGSCASWASDPAAAEYKVVEGWPDWMCADLPDAADSIWYVTNAGVETAIRYNGTCASWIRTADASLTDYREIAGWASWLCADFMDGRAASMWFLKATGKTSAAEYRGTCDSWATVAATTDEIGSYHEVAGWPQWLCADYKDGRKSSRWYVKDKDVATAADYGGDCASWSVKVAVQAPPPPANELLDYREIQGWPTWLCADFKDARAESMWYVKATMDPTKAVKYAKKCDDWAIVPPAVDPNAVGAYREIAGWPTWLCADFVDVNRKESKWYVKASGVATATVYGKRCDEWAVSQPVLTAYRDIAGWSAWLCADFTDGRPESMWYLKSGTPDSALKYGGNCDSWKK